MAKCTSRVDHILSQVNGTSWVNGTPLSLSFMLNCRNLDSSAQIQDRSQARAMLGAAQCLHSCSGCQPPSACTFPKTSGSSGDSSSAASQVLGLGDDGCSSVRARDAAIPAGTQPILRQQHPKLQPQGLGQNFHTPTELTSLISFKPGSDSVYFILNLIFVVVFQVSHCHPAPSPQDALTPGAPGAQEVSAGIFVSFTPR